MRFDGFLTISVLKNRLADLDLVATTLSLALSGVCALSLYLHDWYCTASVDSTIVH